MSNAADLPIPPGARRLRDWAAPLLERIRLELEAGNLENAAPACAQLLEGLNRAWGLPPLRLQLRDEPRKVYGSGRWYTERYGYYLPRSRTVVTYMRTARRQQLVAFRTFMTTLLHEWVHHYDIQGLGIRSLHTAGFYRRLRSLKQVLGLDPGVPRTRR